MSEADWTPRKTAGDGAEFTIRRSERKHRQADFFDVDERLQALSTTGDLTERLAGAQALICFRLIRTLDRTKSGRPLFDVVPMFKDLVLPPLRMLVDDRIEYPGATYSRFHPTRWCADHQKLWPFRERLMRVPMLLIAVPMI